MTPTMGQWSPSARMTLNRDTRARARCPPGGAMITDVRQLEALTREESLRLLGSVSLGRVVFTQFALPAIRPVNHLVEGDKIVIRTHIGATITSAVDGTGTVVAYEADMIDADEVLASRGKGGG